MLNHNLEHLEEVKNQIINWPLIKQAEYADDICTHSVESNDHEFIKQQMDAVKTDDITLFETFNATSIGNLAYLALYAPNEYAQKAKVILENYKTYASK